MLQWEYNSYDLKKKIIISAFKMQPVTNTLGKEKEIFQWNNSKNQRPRDSRKESWQHRTPKLLRATACNTAVQDSDRHSLFRKNIIHKSTKQHKMKRSVFLVFTNLQLLEVCLFSNIKCTVLWGCLEQGNGFITQDKAGVTWKERSYH